MWFMGAGWYVRGLSCSKGQTPAGLKPGCQIRESPDLSGLSLSNGGEGGIRTLNGGGVVRLSPRYLKSSYFQKGQKRT